MVKPAGSTSGTRRYRVAACAVGLMLAGSAAGFDVVDPLATGGEAAAGPAGAMARPCGKAGPGALSLAEVVDRTLCNNPQTREAWANARFQAAQLGVAESAYLPSVNGSASVSRNDSRGGSGSQDGSFDQTSGSLTVNYLLFDFGGRAAGVSSARQLLAALNATQEATVQSLFLSAVQAYYQWFAALAAVDAAAESERAALESLKAATRRYEVGVATPADRLQAQTAYSQAVLSRIQAEGDAKNARGALANAMGADADEAVDVLPPDGAVPDTAFARDLSRLIADAKHRRPDLAAAEAQVKAAEASVDVARSSGLPTVSLVAGRDYNRISGFDATRSGSLGVAVNIPLFSGFATTYRIRAAEQQVAVKAAQRDRIERQVALDVWRSYYNLETQGQSVRASADLVASAEQSLKVALGRYKAGVGGILDLLNAQSAAAAARQQDIQARYAWRLARFTLAQAMGQLDFGLLDAASRR